MYRDTPERNSPALSSSSSSAPTRASRRLRHQPPHTLPGEVPRRLRRRGSRIVYESAAVRERRDQRWEDKEFQRVTSGRAAAQRRDIGTVAEEEEDGQGERSQSQGNGDSLAESAGLP